MDYRNFSLWRAMHGWAQRREYICHPIGAIFHTYHGTTNTVCMPSVLMPNTPAISNRFDEVSIYLGIASESDGFWAFAQRFNDHLGWESL